MWRSYHNDVDANAPGEHQGGIMRQLRSIYVSFLNMVTSTVFVHAYRRNIYGRPGAPGGGGIVVTKRILLALLARVQPFRRRLAEDAFGLANACCIQDPPFLRDFPVRQAPVPAPRSPEQLAGVVSR